MLENWDLLPADVRDQADAELRRRSWLLALRIVRDGCGLTPKPELHEVQHFVFQRMADLDARGEVEPEPSTEVPVLVAKARAIGQPVRSVEATWDGDSCGWMVVLDAIVVGEASARVCLGEIRDHKGVEAEAKGRAVAEALGVPFRFDHSDGPKG